MMNRLIIVVLAVLLVGSAGFSLSQLSELKKLKQSLGNLARERSDLEKRIWDLEKRNGELEKRLPRATDSSTAAIGRGEAAGDFVAGLDPELTGPRSRGGVFGGRVAALMASPEVQKLMAVQQKGALDGRYAALFKQLQLSPAELEKFKNLLVEKQSAVMDVMAAARAQGLTGPGNREQVQELVQSAQAEVENTIHSSLGDAAYAQYQSYETTLPERNVVNQLEQRLSYSSTPLTDTQAAQLVQFLTQTAPAGTNAGSGFAQLLGGGPRGSGPGGSATITNDALALAENVLGPQQLAALQVIQQEQQAAALLRQQLRAGLQTGSQGTTNSSPSAPNSPGPTGPGGG